MSYVHCLRHPKLLSPPFPLLPNPFSPGCMNCLIACGKGLGKEHHLSQHVWEQRRSWSKVFKADPQNMRREKS